MSWSLFCCLIYRQVLKDLQFCSNNPSACVTALCHATLFDANPSSQVQGNLNLVYSEDVVNFKCIWIPSNVVYRTSMATFPSDCYFCNNEQRPDVGKCDQSLPPQEEFSSPPPAPPRGIIIRYQYQENITQVVLRGNSRVRRHGVSFPCGHSPSPELRTCPLTTPDCHRAAAVRRPLQVESRLAIVTLHIRAVTGTLQNFTVLGNRCRIGGSLLPTHRHI